MGATAALALFAAPAVAAAAPELTVDPGSHDFGDVRVGEVSPTFDFTVENTGDEPLNVDSFTEVGDDCESFNFTFFNTGPSIQPGNTRTFSAEFTPTVTGAHTCDVEIASDDPNSPDTVTVSGTGVSPPEIFIDPQQDITFPDTVVGDTSDAETFTIENVAGSFGEDLEISLSISGADSGSFSVEAAACASLASCVLQSGDSITVSVTFTPGDRGGHAAILEIGHDDPSRTSPIELTLTGTGVAPAIAIDPEQDIQFPNTAVGETSDAESFTISNSGAADLTVSVGIVGTDASAFAVEVQACSESGCVIAPDSSVTVRITFTPDSTGTHTADLQIDHDDPDRASPIELALAGDGTQASAVLVTQDTINFGDVRVDATSSPEDVQIRNDGNADLTITNAALGGSNPAEFAVATDPTGGTQLTLAPSETATWELVCEPSDRGSFSAVFTVDSDDPDNPQIDVALSCNGTEAELVSDPSPIEFPITRVGETSLVDATLINDGNVDLEVESLSLSVSVIRLIDPPTTPFVLAPGESQQLTLEFAPEQSADVNATLTAQAPELDQPAEFEIIAPGRIAEADLSAASIDFGDVRVDGQPATRDLVLENIGDAGFAISRITVDDGTSFSADVASGSLPREVGPGETITFEIDAHPVTVGTKRGVVTIETDIPGGRFLTVEVQVTGIAPDLVVSAGAIDFGAHDVLANPVLRTVTVENHPDASDALDLESIQIAGPGSGAYFLSSDGGIPTTLAPGDGVDVVVGYDPQVASQGEPAADIVVTSDVRVAEIALFGRGIDREISVSPQSVVFPETYRNPDTPPTRSVDIENLGEAPLVVSATAVGGAAPEAFQITGDAPVTIQSGQSSTIEIAFVPTVASSAPLEANLVIESDDSQRPAVEIALSGRAVLPNLSMSPGRVELGRTGVGVPVTLPGSITVENRDDDDTLRVRDMQLSGDDEDFRVTGWGGDAVDLAPGDSIELGVEFSPTSPGTREAYLELYLDGDSERVAVTELRGEGMPFRVRGGGCRAAGEGGAASALLLLLAAGWIACARRVRRNARTA